MKNLFTALGLICISLFFPSCSKHPDCHGEGGGMIAFKGFDSSVLEKVTITTFKPGSDFSEKIDSNTYTLSAYSGRIQRYDTANGFITWPYYSAVGLNDVLIEIASSGKIYRITNITPTNAKNEVIGGFMSSGGASSKDCYNVIESYNLNGKVIVTGASPAYGTDSGTDLNITP